MHDLELMCEKLNSGNYPHYQLDAHGRTWRKDKEGAEWREVKVLETITKEARG
jgi:hypothetical protein